MPPRLRTSRTGFRRALAASVAVHLAVAAVVLIVARSGDETGPGQPEIDTRVRDVVVRMSIPDDPPVVPTRIEEPPAPPPGPARAEGPPPEATGARPPLATTVPNPLPAELVALLRRPTGVAQQPTPDPNLAPAGGRAAPPIHGALAPGQVIVYVLDCSGSMGEFGKFAAARAALAATLRRQPESVRFQVIAYAGTAKGVFPGGCVPATGANVALAEEHLAGLRPSGPSNHPEAVRLAAALRPEVIVLLTDATNLSANKLKPVPAGGGKPVPVCVARVTADGVDPPRELK